MGERETPLIDLGNIDRVPVTIVIGADDDVCPVEYAEWHYNMMTTPEKYIRFEIGGHGIFALNTHERFVDRMV